MNPIQTLLKNTISSYKDYLFNNSFFCPLCEKSFDNSSFIGINPESEFLCPNCKSSKFERYLWIFLNSRTNLIHNSSLELDNENYRQNILLIDLDNSLSSRLSKSKNINCITLDSNYRNEHFFIKQIENGSIDLIIGNYLLEKSNQFDFIINELKRILKEDTGIIILQTDIDETLEKTLSFDRVFYEKERERIYGNKSYYRRFGRDFDNKLNGYNFVLNYHDNNDDSNFLNKEIIQKLKLNELQNKIAILHIDSNIEDDIFSSDTITVNDDYIEFIKTKVDDLNLQYKRKNIVSKLIYLTLKTISFTNGYIISNISTSISYFTKGKELLGDAIFGIITGLMIGFGNVLSYPDFEIHNKITSLGVLLAVIGIWFFISRQLWNFYRTDYFNRILIKNLLFSIIVFLIVSTIFFKFPNCGISQQFYDWELNSVYGGDKELMHKWKNR